ncbi:hypothetical protein [Nocardioides ungokensis]|nr:hypothetical protein [Nocardioides ungokensis]
MRLVPVAAITATALLSGVVAWQVASADDTRHVTPYTPTGTTPRAPAW